jgi:hypothetical protein
MTTSLANPFQFLAHQSSLHYTFFCLSYWQHRETNHRKICNNVRSIGLQNYFLHLFAVLCPVIFFLLSTSFFLSGIVASCFYPLYSSLQPFYSFTYTCNFLLYICSVFYKLVFEIHIGRCCITIDLSPSLSKFSANKTYVCEPLQTQYLTLGSPLPFMQRNVNIKLTKASVILRICCSAIPVNRWENNCLFCALRCLEQCVGESELHRLYLKCLDQFQEWVLHIKTKKKFVYTYVRKWTVFELNRKIKFSQKYINCVIATVFYLELT